MEELNANIELKESRSQRIVPVVNGIYLHSIYNPEKEAAAFAQTYEDSIKSKNSFLILGLGFGYHIEEVANIAAKYHETFTIKVLEPNRELIEKFMQNSGFESENIEIVHSTNPTEIFDREDFIMFLASKPAIIRHETSFNLSKDFYRSFLTFKAPTSMTAYERLLSKRSKGVFAIKEGSIAQNIEVMKKTERFSSKKDYAFFVMEAIVNSSKKASKGL